MQREYMVRGSVYVHHPTSSTARHFVVIYQWLGAHERACAVARVEPTRVVAAVEVDRVAVHLLAAPQHAGLRVSDVRLAVRAQSVHSIVCDVTEIRALDGGSNWVNCP